MLKKIEIISITDHDSIDAYYDLENDGLRKLYSGIIITGSELKTYYNNVSIEVLAYGVDYHKLRINKIDNETIKKNVMIKSKK